MTVAQHIRDHVKSALDGLGVDVGEIVLMHPQTASQGDYATNVAMIAAKHAGKNPRELAQAIVDSLKTKNEELKEVEKIEVAGPGFINFYLTPSYFIGELKNLLKGNKSERKTSFSGKKVMVEFTDPNPFKELHIGHLYDNTIGESLSRFIEALGADVRRVTYQGDVGLHVAKSLYGLQRKLNEQHVSLSEIEEKSLSERIKFLGESYAIGSTAYEEDEAAKQEIIALNKAVYENDPSIHEAYAKGREWSLQYFDTIYERLGSKFWKNYFESEAGPIGLKLVREYIEKGVFKESDGAVVFPGDEHGLHTRVFINSLGLPTYEAKELGLAPTKYNDYQYDLSIIVTGNEINEYFKVLLKALSIIRPDLAERTRHISHGMVRLPEGKMSSRTGNVRTGEWLLNEAKGRLHDAYPEMEEETLEAVSVGAVKWALLRTGIGKDISFNIDESISFEGDSGPYIQYTYARTQSVLSKSETQNPNLETDISLEPEERQLLKLLARFDEVTQEAGEHYSPNIMTNYLFDVAQAFNLFYQKQRILHADEPHKAFRLALTNGTGMTLKAGLYLLGIKAPERM